MALMVMADGDADKQRVLDRIGDLSGFKVFGPWVLVGLYLRGQKTASGIHLPDSVRKEDEHQGKTGLVLAKGPQAFKDSPNYSFDGQDVDVGDWVSFKVGDGWPVSLNGKEGQCRLVLDQDIRFSPPRPDLVW